MFVTVIGAIHRLLESQASEKTVHADQKDQAQVQYHVESVRVCIDTVHGVYRDGTIPSRSNIDIGAPHKLSVFRHSFAHLRQHFVSAHVRSILHPKILLTRSIE